MYVYIMSGQCKCKWVNVPVRKGGGSAVFDVAIGLF